MPVTIESQPTKKQAVAVWPVWDSSSSETLSPSNWQKLN